VTAFFRDPKAFDFIQTDILPGLLNSHAPGEELKIWIAGCLPEKKPIHWLY